MNPSPLLSCLPEFRRALTDRACRPRTVACYLEDVRRFARWFARRRGETAPLSAVSTADLLAYRVHLHRMEGLTPNTVNRRLTGLRAFFDWAVATSRLPANPATAVRGVQGAKSPPRTLSPAQEGRLLDGLAQTVRQSRERLQSDPSPHRQEEWRRALRNRAIVLLLLRAGLRVLETVRLSLSDVSLAAEKGFIRVREGKGGRPRTVPLPPEARAALEAYLAARPKGPGDRLFPGRRQEALAPRQVQRILKQCARQAGLPPRTVTGHVLRHTCAKNLLSAGLPPEEVAHRMGHASPATPLRYLARPRQKETEQAEEPPGG